MRLQSLNNSGFLMTATQPNWLGVRDALASGRLLGGLFVFILASSPVLVMAQDLIEPSASAQARLIAHKEARLSVEMAGKIQAFHVEEGASFRAGDVLADLACGVERAQLKKAQTSLEEAEQILAANERLATHRSIGDLELSLSKVRANRAKADVAIVSAQVERCQVKAPFDGVLARRHKREAEYIRVGEPLIDVINVATLEVEFLAPSAWLEWLKPGAEFTLSLNELALELPGELTQIGVSVDPVSRTVRLKGELTEIFDGVAPGMSGDVRFGALP